MASFLNLRFFGKSSSSLFNAYHSSIFLTAVPSSDVTPEMKIFKEEVFGPVMTVIKVPNDSDIECVRIVNNCSFGLGSSIFSADAAKALEVGRQFRTGMVTVSK